MGWKMDGKMMKKKDWLYIDEVKKIMEILRKSMVGRMVVMMIVVIGCFLMMEREKGDEVDEYGVKLGGDEGKIEEMRERWGMEK